MDKALNSEENKQLFSTASVLEKLAFKKVSEEDATTEVEIELESVLQKKASCCECEEDKKHSDCKCDCHHKKSESSQKQHLTVVYPDCVDALLKVSAILDESGFEKLAAHSAILADKLIVEAKAKSKSKSEKSDKKSKDDKKKSKPKMDMKERMKKMREMAGKGKKDKKDSKEDKSKKSSK